MFHIVTFVYKYVKAI